MTTFFIKTSCETYVYCHAEWITIFRDINQLESTQQPLKHYCKLSTDAFTHAERSRASHYAMEIRS